MKPLQFDDANQITIKYERPEEKKSEKWALFWLISLYILIYFSLQPNMAVHQIIHFHFGLESLLSRGGFRPKHADTRRPQKRQA